MEDRQVSLKQVLDTVDEMPVMKDNNGMEFIEKSLVKTRIGMLQPELNEWCSDCKEYDHERHCCPRFNRVIRETLEEIQAEQKPEQRSFSCGQGNDTISRQAAIHERIFQEIVVEYLSYCAYPEYKGKPYFSIKYTKNGHEFIGYGTYIPEVLSEYLKEYFMPSAQPEKRTKERTETHACDSISRQDAIDIFDDYNISVENGELEAYSRDRKRLCDLPSAQTETAKRIVGKSRNGMTLWYQCDMCNEPVDAQDNFCRGCGRRLTDG